MYRSLIVGFGYAGRMLHLPCIRKVQKHCNKSEFIFDSKVGAVDPLLSVRAGQDTDNLEYFTKLTDIQLFDPNQTIVHICTAPEKHFDTIKQVADLGYKKIIVEKPLTISLENLEKIIEIEKARKLDILVVANWVYSSLTARINEIISTKIYGRVLHLSIEQNKPRFSRTIANSTHTTVFDVEIPHEVALSQYLLGPIKEITGSMYGDMVFNGTIVRKMGKVQIALLHQNGHTSALYSDLTSPIRKRVVNVYFEDHLIVGNYPIGSDDNHSQVSVFHDSKLFNSEIIPDDPLTSCLTEFYKYFIGEIQDKPVSDLLFNSEVIRAIYRSKLLNGIVI